MDHIQVPVGIGHCHDMGIAFTALVLLRGKPSRLVERNEVVILIEDQFTYSFHFLFLPPRDQ
jgi:hypothetical protein